MTKSNLRETINSDDGALLIEGCRYSVSQCDLLLKRLSADDYVNGSAGASVGAHVRHVLDRFQSFFAGLQCGVVDYDNRKRDRAIETNLEAARSALEFIAKRVDSLVLAAPGQNPIQVKESVYHGGESILIPSSVERELMGLITHSTHHLAIIALLIKPLGYAMASDFGKAASTIRYERSVQAPIRS